MRKRKKRGKFLSFLLLIAITAVVFNRSAIYHQIKSFVGFGALQVYEVRSIDLAYDLEKGIVPLVSLIDGHPVAVVDSTITCYTDEGEAKWQQPTDFEDVLISGNSNFFAMADAGKGNIMVYDYSGNVNASLFGEGELADMVISPEGYILVLKAGSGEMEVFDPKLNLISNLAHHAGDVVAIKIGASDGLFYIGTVDMEEGGIVSYLYKYDAYGNLVGSVQMIDEILLEFYLGDSNIIALTDQDITTYSREMEELSTVNAIGEIDVCAYQDSQLTMQIFDKKSEVSEAASDYDLIRFDLDKNEVGYNKSLPARYSDIVAFDKYQVFYNNNSMILIDSEGEIAQSFDLEREVASLELIDKGRFLMTGMDYFTVFELRH